MSVINRRHNQFTLIRFLMVSAIWLFYLLSAQAVKATDKSKRESLHYVNCEASAATSNKWIEADAHMAPPASSLWNFAQAWTNSSDKYIGGSVVGADHCLYGVGSYASTNGAIDDFDSGSTGASGLSDAFIFKINPRGERVFGFKIGTDGLDYGRAICVDPNGDFYVAASFGGNNSISLKGVIGQDISVPNAPTQNLDLVIIKYSRDGEYIWHVFGESDGDLDIHDLKEGRIKMTASTDGVFVSCQNRGDDFSMAGQQVDIDSNQGLLIKLDFDGNVKWITKSMSEQDADVWFTDLTSDGQDIYAMGNIQCSGAPEGINFLDENGNKVPALQIESNADGTWDGFLARFDGRDMSNGAALQTALLTSAHDFQPRNVTYESGALYYAAISKKQVTLPDGGFVNTANSDNEDIFMVKADPNTFATLDVLEFDGHPGRDFVYDLSSSNSSISLLAGVTTDFSSPAGSVDVVSSEYTPFIMTLDLNQNQIQLTQFTNSDQADGQVVSDDFGNIYVTGSYNGDISFDGIVLPTSDPTHNNLYVARLNCNPVVSDPRSLGGGLCGTSSDTLVVDTYYGVIDWQRFDGAHWADLGVQHDTLIYTSTQNERFRVKVSPLAKDLGCASAPPVYSNHVDVEILDNNSISVSQSTHCPGVQFLVSGSAPSVLSGPMEYSWYMSKDNTTWTQLSDTTQNLPAFSISESIYLARSIRTSACFIRSNTLSLDTYTENITIGENVTILPGASAQLSANNATSYRWSPVATLSNHTSASPVATPTASTTYTAELGFGSGCIKRLTQKVNLVPDCYRQLSNWQPPSVMAEDGGPVDLHQYLLPMTFITGMSTSFSNGLNGSENNAIGAPDGRLVELYDAQDSLILLMESGIHLGENIIFSWQMRGDAGFSASAVSPKVYLSENGVDFDGPYEPGTITSTTLSETSWTPPIPFKYIAFTNPTGAQDYELDAVSVSESGSLTGGKWTGPGMQNDSIFNPAGLSGDVTLNYAVESPCIANTDKTIQVFQAGLCDGVSFVNCPTDISAVASTGACSANVNYTVETEDFCGNTCAPEFIEGFEFLGDYEGHRYFKSTYAALWNEANDSAVAVGGHLVTFSSPEEEQFIKSFDQERRWIGLHDRNSEGTFEWVTGEPLVYQNWSNTTTWGQQPNDLTNQQDFVSMNFHDDEKWNDEFWWEQFEFVIEFDCLVNQTAGIASGEVFPLGTTVNTFEVRYDDDPAHVQTCEFDVTVTEVDPPTLLCPPSQTVSVDPITGLGTILPDFSAFDLQDDCGTWGTEVLPNHNFLGVYNDHAYYIRYSAGTWEQHRDWAIAEGGYLTTINSSAENDWILDHIPDNAYIGYNDYDTEGAWEWANGESNGFENWNTISPNNEPSNWTNGGIVPEGEDGAAITFPDGLWDSWLVNAGGMGIVEFDELPELTLNRSSGPHAYEELPVGNYTQYYVATDGSGNQTTCQVDFNLVDDTPPTITCPPHINATLAPGYCSLLLNMGLPVVSDNSAGLQYSNSITGTQNNSADFSLGTTDITWSAVDIASQTASCVQQVTVGPAITTLNAQDQTVIEGGVLSVDFILDYPLCEPMVLTYQTVDATASDAQDYTALSGSVTFAAGELSKTIQVQTTADNLFEYDEEFKLSFSVDKSYVNIGSGSVLATIVADDPKPEISISDASTLEGGDLSFQVSIDVLSGQDVTFNATTIEVTADSPDDYTALSAVSGLIPAGSSSTSIIVSTVHDFDIEQDETFQCQINNLLHTNPGNLVATGTIINNDEAPVFTTCISDSTVFFDSSCQYQVPDFSSLVSVSDDDTPASSLNLTQSPVAGTVVSSHGITTVTIQAEDANGLTSTCEFDLTVSDNTSATISCPADILVDNDLDACFATGLNLGEPAVGSCTAYEFTHDAPAQFDVGQTTVTWSAEEVLPYTTDIGEKCIFPPGPQGPISSGTGGASLGENISIHMATSADIVSDDLSVGPGTTCNGGPCDYSGTTIELFGINVDNGNGSDGDLNSGGTISSDKNFHEMIFPSNSTVNITGDVTLKVQTDLSMGSGSTLNIDGHVIIHSDEIDFKDGAALNLISGSVTFFVESKFDAEEQVVFSASDYSDIVILANDVVHFHNGFSGGALVYSNGETTVYEDVDFTGSIVSYELEVRDNSTLTWINVNSSKACLNSSPGNAPIILNGSGAANHAVSYPEHADVLVADYSGSDNIHSESNGLTWGVSGPDVSEFTLDPATGELAFVERPDYESPTDQDVDNNYELIITLTDDDGFSVTQNLTVQVDDSPFINSYTCLQTVTVRDTTPPEISCVTPMSVFAAPSACGAVVTYTPPSGTDNCSVSSVIQTDGTGLTSGDFFPVGTTTLEYEVSDLAGNTDLCSFTITVMDNEFPIITDCPSDDSVLADASCQFVMLDYRSDVIATDNCTPMSNLTITQNPAPGAIISGTTQVAITVEDQSGLTSICTFEVTVADMENPTITGCPSDQTLFVDGTCSYSIPDYTVGLTLSDNCTALNDLMLTQSPPVGTILTGDGMTQVVTLTLEDEAGNADVCSFTVSLEDDLPPLLSNCPSDQTVTVDGTCQYSLPDFRSAITASDNCSASSNLVITQTPPAGTNLIGDGSTQVVTITVEDERGLSTSCDFTVTLDDDTAPIITTCLPDQSVSANMDCEFVMIDYSGLIVATDNCTQESDLIITQSPADGQIISGTTAVTMTVTDEDGLSSTCTFDVTISDTTDPTIVGCPSSQTLSLDANCNYTIPDFAAGLTLADNCSDVLDLVLTQSPAPGGMLSGDGTAQTVTITVTDEALNSASCSFTMTVDDDSSPLISGCPSDQTVEVDDNCFYVLPDFSLQISASDNCTASGDLIITQTPASGTILPGDIDTQTVTLTVTDEDNLSTSCIFTLTLDDSIAPTIMFCPSDDNASANSGCDFVLADYTDLVVATDNCTAPDDLIITQSPAAGSTVSGTTTVTIVVTDQNGLDASCSLDVFVTDTTDPTISNCPLDEIVSVDASCSFEILDYTSIPTLSDNCSPLSSINVTQDPPAGTIITGNGTTQIITLTAEDTNGNSANCSFTITLDDDTAPLLSNCPSDQTVFVDGSCDFAVPDYTLGISASDNCSAFSALVITQTPVPGTVLSGNGTTQVVTLTVEDEEGLGTSCTFTLTLDDDTAPTITSCPADVQLNLNSGCAFVMPDYSGDVVAFDNCTAPHDLIITQQPSPGDNLTGSTLVTMTVTDLNNLQSTCSFTVTPLASINDFSVAQQWLGTSEDSTSVSVTILSDQALCSSDTIYYSLVDGSASSSDYSPSQHSGSFTFNAGESVGMIEIPIVDDNIVESIEDFVFRIDSAYFGNVTSNNSSVISIEDNDTFQYSIAQVVVNEGDQTDVMVEFGAISSVDTFFYISTANDNSANQAVSGQDYLALTNEVLTLEAGSSSAAIAIQTLDDQIYELDEYLTIVLKESPNSAAPLHEGLLRIQSNEEIPELSVMGISVPESEQGILTLRIDSLSAYDISLTYSTLELQSALTNDWAAEGIDYTPVLDSVVIIPAGSDSVNISVQTLQDNTYELTEYVNVAIEVDNGDVLIDPANSQATVAIIDDAEQDLPVLTVSFINETVIEGDIAFFQIHMDYSEVQAQFSYQSNTGSASADDFEQEGMTLFTIPEGVTDTVIAIQTYQDTYDEALENFNLVVQTGSELTLSSGFGNLTISQQIQDDDSPIITCKSDTLYIDQGGQATIELNDWIESSNQGTLGFWDPYEGDTDFACDSLYILTGQSTQVLISVENGDDETHSCMSTVTVLDSISPTYGLIAPVMTELSGDACEIQMQITLPAFSDNDNCAATRLTHPISGLEIVSSIDTVLSAGVHTFYWLLTDPSGNQSLDSTVVTINYSSLAALTYQELIEVDAGANCEMQVSALSCMPENMCSPDLQYSLNGLDWFSYTAGQELTNFFPVGESTVYWRVESNETLTIEGSTEVVVMDTAPPVLTFQPSDIDTCSLVLETLPMPEFDDCDSDLDIDIVVNGGLWNGTAWEFTPGVHSIMYTATDDYNNSTIALTEVNMNAISESVYGIGDTTLSYRFETSLNVLPVAGAVGWQWTTTGEAIISNPNAAFTEVHGLGFGMNEFIIEVETDCGIVGRDTVFVLVDDIHVPSGFSPNGDGTNEFFVIRGIENLAPNDFTVFNRWGLKVFESKDYENDWDGTSKNGKAVPADTYYFILNLPDRNPYKGYIELKR